MHGSTVIEPPNRLEPLSLERICYRVLVNHRDWLGEKQDLVIWFLYLCCDSEECNRGVLMLPGDIGDTPLDLVHGILQVCSAEQLARIEDETW